MGERGIIKLRSNFATDRQTNSLTPYTGGCGFFLQVKFATSLLASLAGDNQKMHQTSLLPSPCSVTSFITAPKDSHIPRLIHMCFHSSISSHCFIQKWIRALYPGVVGFVIYNPGVLQLEMVHACKMKQDWFLTSFKNRKWDFFTEVSLDLDLCFNDFCSMVYCVLRLMLTL